MLTGLARSSLTIALVLASLSTTACDPATVTDPSRRIYCQVLADAPERDNDDAPKKIIARVRYSCYPPGLDKLTLTLRLQRQDSRGRWVDVVKTSFTARKGETVSPKGEVYRTKQLTASCRSGVYRTVVQGSGTARGYTNRYDVASPRSFDPCRPSIFAQR